jgi:4'-phosphopantetheinyl transferase
VRHVLNSLTDLPTIGRGPHPLPGPLDVHVWRHDHGGSIGPERISALLSLLSRDEHTRFARLRDNRRRQHFVVGRALCRRVLSRYAPVPPEEWRFALGSRGKPFVAAPALSSPLWFNLSHTDGVSVCAVTGAGPEIGIDIERIALGRDALEIAEQFFPWVEVNALRLLPAAQRAERFVRIWALKESFVKARETSLADGICGTAFDLARPDDIGVTFREPLHERAQEWQFNLFRLDLARIVALAVRTQTTGPLSLRAGTCLEL